jgi:broad specificity phosphatase PhoE
MNSKESKTANLFISRHCKTQWNIDKRLQGSKDLPLSEEGKKQAQENIKNLKPLNIDRIITSKTKRAYETGLIYAKSFNIPIDTLSGLNEIDHGDWEGKIIPDLLKDPNSNYGKWLENPENVEIPNSKETMNMAQERVLQAIQTISLQYPHENILVIIHKHIRSLLFCALKKQAISCIQQNIEESILPKKIYSN